MTAISELPSASLPRSSSIPEGARIIIDTWARYKALVDDYLAELAALVAEEEAARPGISSFSLITSGRDATPDVDAIAEDARDQLVHFAERYFAPQGARLEISLPSSEELSAVDRKKLDLEGVWAFLASTYGGDGGARKAYGDLAKKLGRGLSIKVGMEPKTVGGRLVLDRSVYGDRTFGDILSFRDVEALGEVLDGFLAVAEWSGCWNVSERSDLRAVRADIDMAEKRKVLPGRRSIGGDILVVPFKSKWEFRISPAFGAQMQLFLSEFNGYQQPGIW